MWGEGIGELVATSPGDRLKEARLRHYESAGEAARVHGFHPQNLRDHEAGRRGINPDQAKRYGRAFQVSAAWLLTGEGSARRATIPIVGAVGADAEFVGIDDYALGAGLDEIETPPGTPEGAVAVIVRGDSMHPAIRDGMVLVYWAKATDPTPLIGEDCFVRVADGRTLVKTLERGSEPGLWTLVSINSAVPPVRDVRVEWAAPIEVRLRRAAWRS